MTTRPRKSSAPRQPSAAARKRSWNAADSFWLAGTALFLLLKLAAWRSGSVFFWSVDPLAHVPAWLALVALALHAASMFPPLYAARRDASPAEGAAQKTPAAAWAIPSIVLFAGLCLLFRVQSDFLGNSNDILRQLLLSLRGKESGSGVFLQTQPATTLFYHALTNAWYGIFHPALDDPDALTAVFLFVGCVACALFLLGAGRFALRLSPSGVARAAVLFLFIGLPATVFFFGYAEYYTLMYILLIWYFHFSFRALRGEGGLLPAGGFLLAAVLCHATALMLLPSFLLLAMQTRTNRPIRASRLLLLMLFCAAAGFAYYFLSGQFRGEGFFIPLAATRQSSYTLFSLLHLTDLMNMAVLYLPVPLLLLGYGLIRSRKPIPGDSPHVGFAIVAAAFPLMFLGIWNSLLGMARDWDVVSFFGLSSAAAACFMLYALPGGMRSLERVSLPVIFLSLSNLLPWIGMNASHAESLARFEWILRAYAPVVSRQGTLTGYEHLRELAFAWGNYPTEKQLLVEMLNYSRDPFDVSKLIQAQIRCNIPEENEQIIDLCARTLRGTLGFYRDGALTPAERNAVERNFSRAFVDCINYYLTVYKRDKAAELAGRLAADFPRLSFGYTILSYTETSLLHYETGLEYSRRAIACGTPDEVTWSNKGYCELNLGRFDSAKVSFTCALGINPELTTAYYGLGQAALQGFADTAGALRSFRIYRDKESNARMKARANEILRALGSE